MLPCVCSGTDHRRCQNVVRTSATHSAIASCATYLLLPHFDVRLLYIKGLKDLAFCHNISYLLFAFISHITG